MVRFILLCLLLFSLLFAFTHQPAGAAPPPQGQPAGGPPIKLLTRTFTPPPGLDPALRSLATAQAAGQRHVLLQLDYIPTARQQAELAAQGIILQAYVPEQAWIALVPAGRLAAVATVTGVRWLGPWQPADKIQPGLQAGRVSGYALHPSGRVMVLVLPHADVSLEQAEALVRAHNGVVAGRISLPRALTAWLMPADIAGLAAEEAILWLEEGPPPLTATNDGARAALRVTSFFPNNGLTGSGVKLFVYDVGHVDSHPAFSGRLTYVDNSAVEEHATHVAGTAAGSGSGSPAGRNLQGVAPAAHIYSAGFSASDEGVIFWDNAGDIQADYATARTTFNVDLSTTSLGSNMAQYAGLYPGYTCDKEGDYGVVSGLIDGIVRGDNPTVGSPYISLWSNGNERGFYEMGRCGAMFHTTPPPSCAKNPIHVGATNSDNNTMTTFTSWGPCDDGRLKPVVSGPGCESGQMGEAGINSTIPDNGYGTNCGTSMATPAVAGVTTLAIQKYRLVTNNPTNRPSNAMVKTWLIHTAKDLGRPGPDYMYGYGQVDALAMIDLVANPANYLTDNLAQGQTDEFPYEVPANTSQLKVSLAWDDPAAQPFAVPSLVNNLNLELVSPPASGGVTYHPYSLDPGNPDRPATATGPNTVDNQEQVVINNPAPGQWKIRVVGAGVPSGTQPYALAFSHKATIPGESCTSVIQNGSFESGGAETASSWTISQGRVIDAGPYANGTRVLELGGTDGITETAYQVITLPFSTTSAILSFDRAVTYSHTYLEDSLYAEVRKNSDNVLKGVHDIYSSGWLTATWHTTENIDLSRYRGQTIRLAFRAVGIDSYTDVLPAPDPTTFFIDNVNLTVCTDPNFVLSKVYLPLTEKNFK